MKTNSHKKLLGLFRRLFNIISGLYDRLKNESYNCHRLCCLPSWARGKNIPVEYVCFWGQKETGNSTRIESKISVGFHRELHKQNTENIGVCIGGKKNKNPITFLSETQFYFSCRQFCFYLIKISSILPALKPITHFL